MKIKTLLVALSAASLLSSCGGAKWKTYSYKRKYDANEKAALLLEARAATLGKISKMESKATVLEKTDLHTLKREIKASAEFFTKGEGIEEEITKETDEQNGLIEKFEKTEKGSMVCFDEENHKYATIGEDSLLGTFDYSEEVIPEGYEGYAASEALGDIFDMLSLGANAYEDKKGNPFFLFSDEVETYTPIEWEHDTKIVYSHQKTQYMVSLNEDKSLKSLTSYMSQETNQDPDTQGFYKRNKVVEEDTAEIKFSYGERADGSSKLSAYRDQAKNAYRLAAAPSLSITAYKEDGTELSTKSLPLKLGKQTAFSKYHFAYQDDELPCEIAAEKVASYKLKLVGSSKSNAKDDPVEINMPVEIANYNAGNSNSSYADGAIKMAEQVLFLTVELDVEANADGAALSNVNAFASVSYDW